MRYVLLCAALAAVTQIGQLEDEWGEAEDEQTQPTTSPYSVIGTRHIDTLPKTEYPRAAHERLWAEPELEGDEYRLALHLKDAFRAGQRALQRLCIVEVQGPVQHPGRLILALADAAETEVWRESVEWVSFNPRMRAYWLPVLGEVGRLALRDADGDEESGHAAALGDGAPEALFEVVVPDEPLAVDEGYALLPAWESLVRPGGSLRVRVALPADAEGRLIVTGRLAGRDVLREAVTVARERHAFEWPMDVGGRGPGHYELALRAVLDGRITATRKHGVRVVAGASAPRRFGARYRSLRHTAPVHINYAETMPWDVVWQGKKKRDVVVDFPGQPHRFVLWR
ncbi:MAG: hypothetical protein PVH68_07810, partial [Armatimonadota bacterium]